MPRFISTLAAGGLLMVLPSSGASQTKVSKEEVRCQMFGICQVGAEKKFTLAAISTIAPRAAQADKGVTRSTRPRPGYVATPKSQVVPGTNRARAITPRKSLDMQLAFALDSA